MAEQNQLSPELVRLLIETDEGDPEMAALKRQMETADVLRARATAPDTSKNVFGAMAQGLSGYGAGKAQKEYADLLRPHTQRRQKSRQGLFEAMFPGQAGMATGADRSMGAMQQMPTLGRMGMPMGPDDMPDPYQP